MKNCLNVTSGGTVAGLHHKQLDVVVYLPKYMDISKKFMKGYGSDMERDTLSVLEGTLCLLQLN
jgi:hypothetical protein